MQPLKRYILLQASLCAVINMIVNPLVSWFGNRAMRFTPLPAILIDITVTCLVMSTLIALFITSAIHRDLKAGRISAQGRSVLAGLFSRLPRAGWVLGLLLGAGFAALLVPVTYGAAAMFGFAGLTFGWLILLKIVYPGIVAFVVTRWLIQHQLEAPR